MTMFIVNNTIQKQLLMKHEEKDKSEKWPV
jgi:hypothetical protein